MDDLALLILMAFTMCSAKLKEFVVKKSIFCTSKVSNVIYLEIDCDVSYKTNVTKIIQ